MKRFGFINKFVLTAIITGASVGLLSGCGDSSVSTNGSDNAGENNIGAMTDFNVGDTFRATEPLEFSIFLNDHPNYPNRSDWMFWSELERITNIKLNPIEIPMSDYPQRSTLLISAGETADIMPRFTPGTENPFVASGVLLPVSDYMHLMPNFTHRVEAWGLEDELDTIRQRDGKFYLLPGLHEELRAEYTIAIRDDIFAEHGLGIPETWEELSDSLFVLKEVYPDRTLWSDRWSHSGTGVLNIAAGPFGTIAGWGFNEGLSFNHDEGKFAYAATTDEYRELVEYFRTLATAGIMDAETFSQTDDIAIQKFVNAETVVISSSAQETLRLQETMNTTLGEGNFSVINITVPDGPAGNQINANRMEWGILLPATLVNQPHFEAVLQFIDWLWYSEEGNEFAQWGVEGETFTKDENGVRHLREDISFRAMNTNADLNLQVDFGFGNGVFAYGGTGEIRRSIMNEDELDFHIMMTESKVPAPLNPSAPRTAEQQELISLLVVPLRDHVYSNTAAFIIGTRDISEWDTFISELDSLGATRFIDMVEEARQDFLNN